MRRGTHFPQYANMVLFSLSMLQMSIHLYFLESLFFCQPSEVHVLNICLFLTMFEVNNLKYK